MPDYIFMLESRLMPEQLQMLTRVQLDAQELGLNIYLVGGAVRDLMAGAPIRDLDFAVEGNPQRLVRALKNSSAQAEWDEKLRSAEIVLGNGNCLSVSMARSETFESPGKQAKVSAAPILDDLRRRDFSVNAMGISLTPGSRGLLLDPTNGLADIENRELRILHNYGFAHDPVRLLRLVRLAARLGFRPEGRTQELFRAALERNYQKYVSSGSLGHEAKQIARESNPAAVLKALAGHDLLAVFHPLLPKRKPDYDGVSKFQKYRQQAEEAGYRPNPVVPFLYYFSRRLKGRAQKQMLRNAGLKKETIKKVLGLEKEAKKLVKQMSRRRNLGARDVYHMLTPVDVSLLVFALAEYSDKKKVQSRIHNYLFKYRPLRGKLPARELQLMGVAQGPKFDQILEKYFEAQLDGKLRNRADQLRFLRKVAGVPKPVLKKEEKKTKGKAEKLEAAEEKPAPAEAAPAAPAAGPGKTAEAVPASAAKRPAPAPAKKKAKRKPSSPKRKKPKSGSKPKRRKR